MKHIGKFIGLWLFAAGISSVTSCDDPYAGETYAMYDIQPASSYLSTRAEEFSEWIGIMKYADLYNAVNQATEYFTVLAPTNEAVQAFYQRKGVSSIQELGEEYARNLVTYHLIPDTIGQATFISQEEGSVGFQTVSEDYLTVAIREGEGELGGLNSIYINDEAHVIEFANQVSNGYVYVLEHVLPPLTESVYERFTQQASSYSIFLEALDATTWGDSLATIYKEVVDEYGIVRQQKRNYTVLAVTDAVFRQEGIGSLNDLVQLLGAGSDYTSTTNALNRYVAYHILSGSYNLKGLQTFNSADATSRIWNTCAPEALMRVNYYEGTYYLNYNDEDSRTTFVEEACDLIAKNGYIHQIAGYMPIAEPEPETVYFDVTDYPEIANWIAAGHGTEGMIFQTQQSSEMNCEMQNMSPSCYTFNLNNPGGFSYKVNYFTVKDNDWRDAYNDDFLMLNLGYNGWISMQTPTIMRGRYKVTMYFGYATSMNFIRTSGSGSNGGEMRITFDGANEVAVKPYTTVPSSKLGIYNAVIYDEIEFDTTTSHTFRLVMNDPVASSNASYRIMIDYLLFEPLDIVQ